MHFSSMPRTPCEDAAYEPYEEAADEPVLIVQHLL
jgi:hypothetical protein